MRQCSMVGIPRVVQGVHTRVVYSSPYYPVVYSPPYYPGVIPHRCYIPGCYSSPVLHTRVVRTGMLHGWYVRACYTSGTEGGAYPGWYGKWCIPRVVWVGRHIGRFKACFIGDLGRFYTLFSLILPVIPGYSCSQTPSNPLLNRE